MDSTTLCQGVKATARLLLVLVCACHALLAEDVKLHQQAVHLLERANALSLPGALRNYEQVVTFRVHEPDGSVKEGSFTSLPSASTTR